MNCPSGAAAEHPAAVPASAVRGVSQVLPPAPPAAGQAAAAGGSATRDKELQNTELQATELIPSVSVCPACHHPGHAVGQAGGGEGGETEA